MTKPSDKAITDSLEGVLRENSFARVKVRQWVRKNPDVTEVVSLQRSQWGPQHYINYGLWLNAAGPPGAVKSNRCHVMLREDNFTSDLSEIRRLLDLEQPIEGDRGLALASVVRRDFLPFAEQCRTFAGVRTMFVAGRFVGGGVTIEGRRILGQVQDAGDREKKGT
jgi:hypothetical protein